jgi:hypothetical protein
MEPVRRVSGVFLPITGQEAGHARDMPDGKFVRALT